MPYGDTPPRVTIVAPDDGIFLPPIVTELEKMVHIQPVQFTGHHHNRNQKLYLLNTTPHLQSGNSCLQDN